MGSGVARGWPDRLVDRLHFERGARSAYTALHGEAAGHAVDGGFRYSAIVEIPFYEARRVTIIFHKRSLSPLVFADGPSESPHRFDNGALCMWHPDDSSSMRWRFKNGLLDLLDAIRAHLFREAWWREHGEWLGPEVPHESNPACDKEMA